MSREDPPAMRRIPLSLTSLALVCLLTACGGEQGPTEAATPTVSPSTEPSTASVLNATTPDPMPTSAKPAPQQKSASGTAPATTTTAPAPVVKAPLTCAHLAGAKLGSSKTPYNGYPDYLPLTEGQWSGEDGATVTLQKPCGIGDLDGDGADDAVGVVSVNSGGSGTFYTVAVWRNSGGLPVFRALTDLGDRTPVVSISVAGRRATVVWLTRSPSRGMAELDIRRTSVYKLSGSTLTEVSHSDAPYNP
ncbi:hypothetical protein [Micromonospora humidisoli]|uniref:Repeat domain-containing protein n=1 Tax=Micromonospora humidisoli TaxID=2807622 RepID=A0ABS2J6L5_9ACTN|nr:hypothetical protein [Micromonospora humidisoli]MBM7082206.1 hypothetical protein [Micromonospora humidisoli]